jgi:hypothetical protein
MDKFMLPVLQWLSAHGIDPEVPLVLVSVIAGICVHIMYEEFKIKRLLKTLWNVWKNITMRKSLL